MTLTNKPIGILGGTFDPIHNGHLYLAQALYETMDWQEVRFIPCRQPFFGKMPQASPAHRLAMLQLALEQEHNFDIDTRELTRNTPSYAIDTLLSLRAELGNKQSLCLIVGSDNLASLPQWHHWEELIMLAHFVIVPRPHHEIPNDAIITQFVEQYRTTEAQELHQHAAGLLFICDKVSPPDISATNIRAQIAAGSAPLDAVPAPVWQYIKQHNLYQQE